MKTADEKLLFMINRLLGLSHITFGALSDDQIEQFLRKRRELRTEMMPDKGEGLYKMVDNYNKDRRI